MKLVYNGCLYEARNIPSVDSLRDKYEGDPDVYFSYRSINKLGINPNNTYDTPTGIYAYNVEDMGGERIPFKGENPTEGNRVAYFFKPKSYANKLDVRKYDYGELKEDIIKLKKIKGLSDTDIQSLVEDSLQYAHKPNYPAGRLWYILMKIKDGQADWNALIRKLGYDYVVDHGDGIIHDNEPKQAVFLSANSIDILEYGEDRSFKLRRKDNNFDLVNYLKIHANDLDVYRSITFNKWNSLINNNPDILATSLKEIPEFYKYVLDRNEYTYFEHLNNKYKKSFIVLFKDNLRGYFKTKPYSLYGYDYETLMLIIKLFHNQIADLISNDLISIARTSETLTADQFISVLELFEAEIEDAIRNADPSDLSGFLITASLKHDVDTLNTPLSMDILLEKRLGKVISMFKNAILSNKEFMNNDYEYGVLINKVKEVAGENNI